MKAAFPGGITEDGNLLVLIILLLREDAAEHWLNGQRCEGAGREAGRVDLRRVADAGELIGGVSVAAESREAVRIARVGDDVGPGDAGLVVAADLRALNRVGEDDQLFGMREGKRAQEHAFDDGEDGRGGADAESQHENGSQREAGRLGEMADGDLQVLHAKLLGVMGSGSAWEIRNKKARVVPDTRNGKLLFRNGAVGRGAARVSEKATAVSETGH